MRQELTAIRIRLQRIVLVLVVVLVLERRVLAGWL